MRSVGEPFSVAVHLDDEEELTSGPESVEQRMKERNARNGDLLTIVDIVLNENRNENAFIPRKMFNNKR